MAFSSSITNNRANYEAVFGFDGNSDNSTIATHIKNIRSKLAGYGVTPINTVWGVGYRWEG